MFEYSTEYIKGWVSHDKQTKLIGKLPRYAYVRSVHIHVAEAFDSDGDDNISVGIDATHDALATATACDTTGVKSVTLGVNNGYNAAEQTVMAYYVAGGSAPTTGQAIVVIEFFRVEEQPI